MLRVVLILLLALPLAGATPAHPHDHRYAGAGVPSGSGWAVPSCADVSPLDLDPESGVGGACFPFASVHGDDTGETVWVQVAEDAPAGTVYFFVCMDHDFDGVCTGFGHEILDICHTGYLTAGGYSATTGGLCLAYLDPAPLAQTLYVILIPGQPGSSNAQPVSGRVWLT